MEKRVFLAIFLCFLVLAVYQSYFAPAPPPVAKEATATPAAAVPQTTGGATTPTAPANAGPATVAPAPQTPASTAKVLVGDAAARDIVVETDALIATFNTQGAVLRSYRLKGYHDAKGEPLELIPVDLVGVDKPFTVATDDAQESATLATALYQPSADHLSLGSEPGTLSFEYRDDAGLSARKSFYFQPDKQPFQLNVEASADVRAMPRPITIKFGPGIGLGYSTTGQSFTAPRALQSFDGTIQRLTPTDVQTQARYEGKIAFTGVDDQYFVAVARPNPPSARVEFVPITVPIPGDPKGATRSFIAFSVRPSPGAAPAETVKLPYFIGPKEIDQLRNADPQLTYALDVGWFRVIVTPLLDSLRWIHRYVGNWGWSIVVLTVLINILIFPLRHRSMVSMKKMQAIQPQVKAIQDRYAKYKITDPERQKMNTEMMALYKSKGVSPAGGCLPMLLTMPILLAFYQLLSHAIELRGAPFVGWIHDLAAKDPTYIWPIAMGATMFWQQRMMPTTADPTQQKIFMVMPVVFTLMFLNVPSGLVVYWLVSNLLTIGQQYLTNRIISTRGGPPPAPRVANAPVKVN
jgi:YidC/Oxa1 family membrane protein insertase